jgi:hypothetical protein
LVTVPALYQGPFDEKVLADLVEGKSTLAPKQIREGVVIKKADEPWVRLKWVSQAYKLRKDGTELH